MSRVEACVCRYAFAHPACRTDNKPFPYNLAGTLLASLQGLLNGSRIPLWEVAAQVLAAVLGKKQFRLAVWEEGECISGWVNRTLRGGAQADSLFSLIKSLKSNPNPQAQYWAITSIWQLSFERMAAEGLDKWVTISLFHPGKFTDNGLGNTTSLPF